MTQFNIYYPSPLGLLSITVNDDKIFRPNAWTAFGTKDLEAADYRACRNFGALYKK